jgi:hypothetical protein
MTTFEAKFVKTTKRFHRFDVGTNDAIETGAAIATIYVPVRELANPATAKVRVLVTES